MDPLAVLAYGAGLNKPHPSLEWNAMECNGHVSSEIFFGIA